MDGLSDRPKLQSLGACLLNLGAGDPCPCCGARLQARERALPRPNLLGFGSRPGLLGSAAPRGRLAQGVPTAGLPDAGNAGLVCPECGCELTEVASPFESGTCRSLSPAA
jgi:hypothetical protein